MHGDHRHHSEDHHSKLEKLDDLLHAVLHEHKVLREHLGPGTRPAAPDSPAAAARTISPAAATRDGLKLLAHMDDEVDESARAKPEAKSDTAPAPVHGAEAGGGTKMNHGMGGRDRVKLRFGRAFAAAKAAAAIERNRKAHRQTAGMSRDMSRHQEKIGRRMSQVHEAKRRMSQMMSTACQLHVK